MTHVNFLLLELKQSKLQLKKKWNFSDLLTKPEKYDFLQGGKVIRESVYPAYGFLFWPFHGKMLEWKTIRLLIKNNSDSEQEIVIRIFPEFKRKEFYRNHVMQEDFILDRSTGLPGSCNCYCDDWKRKTGSGEINRPIRTNRNTFH